MSTLSFLPALSVPLLGLFPNSQALCLVGLVLFNIPMPVTLAAVADLLPYNPGLAFGLTTLALLVGVVPVFLLPLAGGAAASALCGDALREGMAVASGLGWYSLAGVTIEGLAGAQMGVVAFLANLMRELASFALIPVIARKLNFFACIGAAAATSEDTTLPVMIRVTDERTVVFSVVNGVVCSALVPVLIAALLG